MTVSILEHELVGIDASGRWCACGERFEAEHLGAIALLMLGAPMSVDERRAIERAQHKQATVEQRLTLTRRILREQQAEWERIGRKLDRMGLSFLDRLDWLEAHYPNARNRERYSTIGTAA